MRFATFLLCVFGSISMAHATPPIGKLAVATVDPVSTSATFQSRLGCKGGVCKTAAPIHALAKQDPKLRLFAGRVEGGWAPYVTVARIELVLDAVEISRNAAGHTIVRARLAPASAKAFSALTAQNVQRRLAIIAGEAVVSAPIVTERIIGPDLLIDLGLNGDAVSFLAAIQRR